MAEVERLIRVEFAKIKVSKQECERCGTKEAQAGRKKNKKKLQEENERYRKEIQKLENTIKNQEGQLVCLRELARTDRVSRRAGQQMVTKEPSGIERAGQQMVTKEPSGIETGMNRKRGTPTSQKEAQQVPKDNSTGGTQDSGGVAADQMGDVSAGAQNLEMDNREVNVANNNPLPNGMNEDEWEAEKKERRTRKNNILVKGLTLRTRHPKEELERWIWDTNRKSELKKLKKEGGGWRARIEEWPKKLEVMRKKASLYTLGWGVWITDDWTDRQKEVQKWLEKEAEAWRLRGKEAITGYQRLQVEGS